MPGSFVPGGPGSVCIWCIYLSIGLQHKIEQNAVYMHMLTWLLCLHLIAEKKMAHAYVCVSCDNTINEKTHRNLYM